MEILKINNNKDFFCISGEEIKPENLDKNNLLKLLNLVYEYHENISFPDQSVLDSLPNPIEREIVQQIISKMKELRDNIPNIKSEINSQFPNLISE